MIQFVKKKKKEKLIPCSLYKRDIMVQFLEKRHYITYTNYKLYKKHETPNIL